MQRKPVTSIRPWLAAASALAAFTLAACQQETKHVQKPAQVFSLQTPIVVEVKKDGTIWLNGEQVTQEELERRLEAMPVEETDVRLHPDNDAPYDDVAKTMAAIQRTGHVKKTGVLGGT